MKRTEYIKQAFIDANPKLMLLEGVEIEVSEIKDRYSTNTDSTINYNPPQIVIVVKKPFLCDNRLVPQTFDGFKVRNEIVGKFPDEFPEPEKDIPLYEYYAPKRYERYVDNNIDLIRRKLRDPDMTRDEILDALVFEGDFLKHIKYCAKLRNQRNS